MLRFPAVFFHLALRTLADRSFSFRQKMGEFSLENMSGPKRKTWSFPDWMGLPNHPTVKLTVDRLYLYTQNFHSAFSFLTFKVDSHRLIDSWGNSVWGNKATWINRLGRQRSKLQKGKETSRRSSEIAYSANLHKNRILFENILRIKKSSWKLKQWW